MKNILFLINKLESGGAQRMFAITISELQKKGFKVKVAYMFGGEKEEVAFKDKVEGVEKFYCNAKGIFDMGALFRLRSFAKKNNIDIVFSTLNESNAFARFLKIVHSKLKVYIREPNIADPKTLKYKLLDLLFNVFVEKIICVSPEVRDSLMKYLFIYGSKLVVLMNCVEIPKVVKNYDDFTAKINSGENINILNIGGYTPKKGQKFLIEAIGNLVSDGMKNLHLQLYGVSYGVGNRHSDALRQQIKETGIQENVEMVDFSDYSKLEFACLNADVFVLSSLYEGCPNVLLEAMSYGLVCVSTRVSGSTTIIQDGENGYLSEVGNASRLANTIKNTIKNQNVFESVGKNARKTIEENYSIDVYLNKLLKIFML